MPEVENTTAQEVTQVSEEQSTEGSTEGQSQETDARKWADKYESPEKLEEGYQNLRLESAELKGQIKELLRDREHAAQAVGQETTSASEPQKTEKQNAADLLQAGRWEDGIREMARQEIASAQKPLVERADGMERDRKVWEIQQGYDSVSSSAKEFPKFRELHPVMDKIFRERIAKNPGYIDSFVSPRDMIVSLYRESAYQNPELFRERGHREAEAAVAGGFGSSSSPGAKSVGPTNGRNQKKPVNPNWAQYGVDKNPFQDIPSREDLQNKAKQDRERKLRELIAGGGQG